MLFFAVVAQTLVAATGTLVVTAVIALVMWRWDTRHNLRGADAVLVVLGVVMVALIVAVIVQGRPVPIGGYLLAAGYLFTGWAMHTRRRRRGS